LGGAKRKEAWEARHFSSRLAGRRGPVGELGDQGGGLVLAQATQSAIGCDIESFHDLACTDCAYSRQGLQDIDDFGVGNDIIRLSKVEHLSKAALAGAKSLFDVSAAATSLRRGMACLLALFVAQRGNRHSSRPHLAARHFGSAISAANQSEI
jgi:hypothetical protein